MTQARIRPTPSSPAAYFRMLLRVRFGRVVGVSRPRIREIPAPIRKN